MMSYKFWHDQSHIYWSKESKMEIITNEQMEDLLQRLKKKKWKVIAPTTDRDAYNGREYSVSKEGDYRRVYLYDKKENKYKRFSTNIHDDTKNSRDDSLKGKGYKAISMLQDYFKQVNGVSFKTAFNTVGELYKICIPKPLLYQNSDFYGHILRTSSVDVGSSYPANICGLLPDAHTSIKKEGTVAPNAEYPFAFYVKSGHLAQYGVFDTHKWLFNNYSQRLFRFGEDEEFHINIISKDDDETILMKASKYQLTSTMEHFYKIKESFKHDSPDYLQAKLIMNSSIGMMHKKEYNEYKYAHLSAVCIARANQELLNMLARINKNDVIQACVDGVMYIGDQMAPNEKKFGKFHQEYTNKETLVTAWLKYIVMDDDGKLIKAKHGNCNKDENGKDIDDSQIKDFNDQYKWQLVKPKLADEFNLLESKGKENVQ